jgi:hypothetical protein
MNERATPIADAFEKGGEVWRAHGFVDENPYETLSREFLAWLIGWSIENERRGDRCRRIVGLDCGDRRGRAAGLDSS